MLFDCAVNKPPAMAIDSLDGTSLLLFSIENVPMENCQISSKDDKDDVEAKNIGKDNTKGEEEYTGNGKEERDGEEDHSSSSPSTSDRFGIYL